MKSLITCFRLALFAGIVLSASLVRAQVITDAINTGGASWFGYATEPITIFGSGFLGVTQVQFGGTNAGFSVLSDSQINSSVPVGAPTGLIAMKKGANPIVYSSTIFRVVSPGPYVSVFSPSGGPGGTVVTMYGVRLGTISGTNGILFNGQKAVAASITGQSQITATAPPGVLTGPITVSSSAGTNNTVTNFFGPPIITGFNPPFGRTGTNVLLSGTNLTGTTTLLFNGIPSTFTINNNFQITAIVPANATTGPFTLSAPGGGYPTSSNFVVLPTITSFSPTFGTVGTSVIINGANFDVGTPTVMFNGVAAGSISGVSFSQLTVTVPAGASSGLITVTTTDGTATSPGLFYLPPIITGFSPTNSLPGNSTTLTGSNFIGATLVQFNGTTASFSNVSINSLVATVPAGFSTGPIKIITPGGTNTTAGLASSNFYGVPVIGSFSPTHGLPGTNVTLTGNNFLGTTAITFNGLAGTALTIVSNGTVRITVPVGATTGPLAVTGPAGVATTVTNFVLDYTSDLAVTITNTPNPVTVFNTLTYSIAVKNRGPHPASAVILTNTLPPGAQIQTGPSVSQGSYSTNATQIIATLGTLNSNGIATLFYTIAPQIAISTLTNLARASSDNVDLILTNNAVTNLTFVEPLPLLSVGLNASNSVLLSWSGALSNYTLQFNPDLAAPTWTNHPIAPVSGGGSNVVTETNLIPANFYRLKR